MSTNKNKLDMMFGAFDAPSDEEDQVMSSPEAKKDKKKKKKSKSGKNSAKRKPEEDIAELQDRVNGNEESKRLKVEEIRGADIIEEEEERLRKEGELMEEIINTGGEAHTGYDENDFVVEMQEYNNCTHEYVAPRNYVRPEFKRPIKKAKQYKFTLDRF